MGIITRDTTEMVQRFDVGPRMSEMAVHNGVCYLAGQVAADGSQDVRGQVRQELAVVLKERDTAKPRA